MQVAPLPRRGDVVLPALDTAFQHPGFRSLHPPAVSMSMPASPGSFGVPTPTAVTTDSADLRRQAIANAAATRTPHRLGAQDKGSNSFQFAPPPERDEMMFRSQPIPRPPPPARARSRGTGGARRAAAMNWPDRRYDSFKTWSGLLERQINHLAGGGDEFDGDDDHGDYGVDDDDDFAASRRTAATSVPEVDRFYAALEGPELDQLKPSEDLVLPSDTLWPFLLRFPISAFALTCAVSLTYACKLAFFFEAVRREYYHPIRVNFFFGPWITLLYLAVGVPHSVASTAALPHWLWYLLMGPFLLLGLKIYGQWMSGGQRRLSKVANPSNHLTVLGAFVGAQLGATMGLREGPIFFFAVGLAHYLVLFVTLYQQLPTNETMPRDLHPVFFLFVAGPTLKV
ncbi:hypothetical protein EJB05_03108, partial [Eragrostis curvula]